MKWFSSFAFAVALTKERQACGMSGPLFAFNSKEWQIRRRISKRWMRKMKNGIWAVRRYQPLTLKGRV
jgi:hypothetical protein